MVTGAGAGAAIGGAAAERVGAADFFGVVDRFFFCGAFPLKAKKAAMPPQQSKRPQIHSNPAHHGKLELAAVVVVVEVVVVDDVVVGGGAISLAILKEVVVVVVVGGMNSGDVQGFGHCHPGPSPLPPGGFTPSI